MSCPVSTITPYSASAVQLFTSFKLLNCKLDLLQLEARTVEALLILEWEYRKEKLNGP